MINYWKNISKIAQRQIRKGLVKYGQPLEANNQMDLSERLDAIAEELIDALFYLEHLRRAYMNTDSYQNAVLRTESHINKHYPRILHACLGLAGEAGECVDLVKKHLFQGHPLDKQKLADELGDVAWYLALAADSIGYDLDDILKLNIEKLRKRYPNGFEVEKSVNRGSENEGD